MMDQSGAPLVSVIIPVLHDAVALERLLDDLPTPAEVEIIVVAGAPVEEARLTDLRDRMPDVRWFRSEPGRGPQMNEGARHARGRWLLFLHADTQLDRNWVDTICHADLDRSVVGGSFRLRFDSSARAARLLESWVRFRVRWFNLPYGDQGLFVRGDVFRQLGGYRSIPLMEDVEFVKRLRQRGRLWHAGMRAVTSARRYERYGWFRRGVENHLLMLLYSLGVSPDRLNRIYCRHDLDRGEPPDLERAVRPASRHRDESATHEQR